MKAGITGWQSVPERLLALSLDVVPVDRGLYLLAWDHDLCRAVAAILARAVFRLLRERARDAGIEGGRAGGVVVIQRFGGALNLNVHFHALILDGVFAPTDTGPVAFHQAASLTTLDVEEVLATLEPWIRGGDRLTDYRESGNLSGNRPRLAGAAIARSYTPSPTLSRTASGACCSRRGRENRVR